MNIKKHILTEAEKWNSSILDGEPIMNLVDYSKIITTYFKQSKKETWLFRGESHLFETPLMPSIFREGISLRNTKYPNKTITDIEISEVEKCQEEVNIGNIKDRYLKAFLPMMHEEDVNWLPLARHFAYKTRLLDVTSNPLVALYFACSTPHKGAIGKDDDAFVYAFDSGNFRPVNGINKKQLTTSDYPPIPINYLDLYDVDSQFENDFDKLPYIFDASIPQQRLVAQSGKFIFWKKPEPVLYKKAIPIRIRASEKSIIIKELSAFGISRKTLFPNE